MSLKDVLKPTSKSSLLTVMIIFIDQRLILLCTISVFIHCVKVDLFFDFPDAIDDDVFPGLNESLKEVKTEFK